MSPAAIAFLLGLVCGPTPAPGPPSTGPTPPSPPVADGIDYPLGRLAYPDFALPGEPFKLVDLRFDVSDTDRTTQAFAARVKVRNFGYLGASFEGERREIAWTSQRLDLSAAGEDGVYDLFASYRAPRFILSTGAQTGGPAEGSGWLLRPALSVRLSPGLEIVARADRQHAEARRPLPPRHVVRLSLAARGAVRGNGRGRAGPRDGRGRFENTRDTGVLSVVGQVGAPSSVARRSSRTWTAASRAGREAPPPRCVCPSPRASCRGRSARPLRAGGRPSGARVPRRPDVVRPSLLPAAGERVRFAGPGPRPPRHEGGRQRAHRLDRRRTPRPERKARPVP